MYSLTYTGVIVALLGTFLVNQLGFTDACSSEITSKLVEYGPLVIGSIMAALGRYRIGGISILGFRK